MIATSTRKLGRDDVVARLVEAASHGQEAVGAQMRALLADRGALLEALAPPREVSTTSLLRSSALTIDLIVFPPGMRAPPHDHQVWAVVGVVAGQERNGLFARDGDGIRPVGEAVADAGGVFELPDDVIHDLRAGRDGAAVSLHVYGGDLHGLQRTGWIPPALRPQPLDRDLIERASAELARRLRAEPGPITADVVERAQFAMFTEPVRTW